MVEGELTPRLPLDFNQCSKTVLTRVKSLELLPLVYRHWVVLIFVFLSCPPHWTATIISSDFPWRDHLISHGCDWNFLKEIYGVSFEEMAICLLFGWSADLSGSPNQTRQTDFVEGAKMDDEIDDFRTLTGIMHELKYKKKFSNKNSQIKILFKLDGPKLIW